MRSPGRKPDLKVIPGEGRRDIYYKRAAIYYILLALPVALLLVIGYRWLGGMLLAGRLQMVIAEPGSMEDSCLLEGIIVRSEQVICSPCSGLLLELAPSGERAAVGETVATIFSATLEEVSGYREEPAENLWEKISGFLRRNTDGRETEDQSPPVYAVPSGTGLWPDRIREVKAQTAGLLSTYIDGWETRPHFPYLDREAYERQCPSGAMTAAGTYVEEGRPILKTVNNWVWYYSVLVPAGEEPVGREKVRLTFSFAPEEAVEAVLEEKRTDLGQGVTGITYRLENQVEGFERNRWAEAVAVYQESRGILVPARALCREPETGLFVDRGGVATFFPVEIIKIQQEQALVEGLPEYSRVITRPDLVTEGFRIY